MMKRVGGVRIGWDIWGGVVYMQFHIGPSKKCVLCFELLLLHPQYKFRLSV